MAFNDIHETILETVVDDEPMAVLRKWPDVGMHMPVAVMFHDGPGMRSATHDFARRLASFGYDVIVPDLYHRHGRMIGFDPDDLASDPEARPKMLEMLTSLTDDGIQRDLDAALSAVKAERPPGLSKRHVCIGFCLGARAVFRTMMRLPERFAAGAMWHPSFLVDGEDDSPHLSASELPGALYAGFAEEDRIMPVSAMQPFIDAVSEASGPVVIDVHPDADHGYSWPSAPTYCHSAAALAWQQTLNVFAATLSGAPDSL